MIPSVGRIVHYTLSDSDIASIPDAASALNAPKAGDVYPLLIVRTWGDTEGSAVNGRVFLDGQHDLWVTSRGQGDQPGQWFQPPVVPPVAAAAPVDPAQLASDFTKTELQAAAGVQGVEVPSGAAKADIAQAIAEQVPDASADPAQLAAENTKADLHAAAAVAGVEVPSGATKADIAEAIVAQAPAPTDEAAEPEPPTP